jgi:hypothetical protein
MKVTFCEVPSIMQTLSIPIIFKFYTILTGRAIQKIRRVTGHQPGRGDRSIVPLFFNSNIPLHFIFSTDTANQQTKPVFPQCHILFLINILF